MNVVWILLRDSVRTLTRTVACAILATLIAVQLSRAQTGRLTVESRPPGAAVYIDSVLVGTTPLREQETTVGQHTLRLVYPSPTSWLAVTKTVAIVVQTGQEARYDIELGSVFTILSTPSGASVLFQERDLGTTPLLYRSERLLSGTLLLKKDGFEPVVISLDQEYPVPSRIALKPLNDINRLPDVLPPDYQESVSPRWATYVAASTMILSGVLSAYWKDRANNDFDRYRLTHDPALLASTQRLDRRSGIAITISHLSFAALAYLLLSE
jgi:hypothetical protein